MLTGTQQTQAIVAGPNVFVSGQIPADTKGNLIEGSIADKTKMCCENIKGILTEAGVAMDRIVKVNVFLDDMANFAEMNGMYEQYFSHKPARSCVAVKQLPKGVPVEIDQTDLYLPAVSRIDRARGVHDRQTCTRGESGAGVDQPHRPDR